MDKIDASIKGAIVMAIFALFGWVISINANVQVNTTNITHAQKSVERATDKYMEATEKLTEAIVELKVAIAEMKPQQ